MAHKKLKIPRMALIVALTPLCQHNTVDRRDYDALRVDVSIWYGKHSRNLAAKELGSRLQLYTHLAISYCKAIVLGSSRKRRARGAWDGAKTEGGA